MLFSTLAGLCKPKARFYIQTVRLARPIPVNFNTRLRPLTSIPDHVLSAALDQSQGSTAQYLVDNTFTLLRKGNAPVAWECYTDLTSRNIEKYISREQYRQLIKYFNQYKPDQTTGLNYVLTLIEDMKRLGYQVGRKEKLLVMRLLGANGNFKAMETIFEDLSREHMLMVADKESALKPFHIMLTAYCDHSDILEPIEAAHKSMSLYDTMLELDISPSSSTTHILLNTIRNVGHSDDIIEEVWDWLWTKIGLDMGGKAQELPASLYREMILYFTSTGRPQYALEINDIMDKKQIPRDVRTMTALIHKVGRSGKVDKAMDLLNDMIVQGIVPNLVTFNALIDIHAHQKPNSDIVGATRIYNMLQEVGLSPDVVTFGTFIDMFAKKGDLKMVKRLYHDMIKQYKIEPTPFIYSSFVECFVRLGDRRSAMDVLRLVEKKQSAHHVTYNLIFKELVKKGHIRQAMGFLQRMIHKEVELTPRAFAPLLQYYAKRGDTEGTHKVASLMTEAHTIPDVITYSILLDSYAKAGDVEGAENIFEIFKKRWNPNLYTYNSMLFVYSKKNDMDRLLVTYKHMTASHVLANEITYGILMQFYSRRKDLRAVESLLETMQKNGVAPSLTCWTILMQTYFEQGRGQDAKKVLEHIIQTGLEPSQVTLSILINSCIKSNQLSMAESIMQETIERTKEYTKLPQHTLLSDSFIDEYAYEENIPETIEDILSRDHPQHPTKTLVPHLFTPLLTAYVEKGDFDLARNLYTTMKELNIQTNPYVYVTLMKMFRVEGDYDAVNTMWEAIQRPQISNQSVDVGGLHIPLPQSENDHKSILTLKSTELMGNNRKDEKSLSFALSIQIGSLVDQGKIDEIIALWKRLENEQFVFDEANWNRYISSLLELNRPELACEEAKRAFFSDVSISIPTKRLRDEFTPDIDDSLHNRTCELFAEYFTIHGHENMGTLRLRSVVLERIRRYTKHNTLNNQP
ncbi:TPR-like protein [Backusella circina FSU 941]|nr:TPR-like protein [Backusella circina FSU 941]